MERTIDSSTICAVSTPPGRGGIAVVRLSGPAAIGIAQAIWKGKPLESVATHTVHLGTLHHDGAVIDRAVATVFRGPGSFTGEDVVELSVHGSTYIQSQVVEALCRAGARVAEPGEFTRRAFTNGRLDLAQAEAVADIIAASSRSAHRLAVSQLNGVFSRTIDDMRERLLRLASLLELELDFSEEDVAFADRTQLTSLTDEVLTAVETLADSFRSGCALRNGIPVAIVGEPNAGKSSLLNALLRRDRAIVSDIPGTTRDTIEETADIGPYTFRFIDTAGLRDTSDPIERFGIDRAIDGASSADIILWLIPADASPTLTEEIRSRLRQVVQPHATLLTIRSKSDLAATPTADMEISTRLPATIDTLRQSLVDIAAEIVGGADDESPVVSNARHHSALTAAAAALRRVQTGLTDGTYTDLVAQDLRHALHHLATITGAITPPDLLQSIFSTFCIGK